MSDLFNSSIQFLLLRDKIFFERGDLFLDIFIGLILDFFLLKKILQCAGHALKYKEHSLKNMFQVQTSGSQQVGCRSILNK